MAKKNIIDLEKDKFDVDGRVRVALDATADQDVIVKNADSEPVPVKIINTDASIDLEVNIGESITVDTTTPLDVNITNTSVDVDITALDGDGDLGVKIQNTSDINVNVTNASQDVSLLDLDINGRLPVSVENTPSVTVSNASLNTNATIQNSSLDVNVLNSSINTNATIQGTPTVTISGDVGIDDATAIRVDVTNSFVNVYDKLYDGSSWVNQLSDSNGKAIVLEKKYYSASDITALGSSTSVREWLNAYADGILAYKYVGSYDDEFEVEVYLSHPDLGDGNKCLKLIYDYSTQNSLKVVQSVYCSVVDWTFDNSVIGTLTLTLGTVTSPDPNSTIAVGTDICTIAVSNTGQGSITISLSGTNASLYTLNNVTDAVTGSSLAYDPLKSYVLETASDFSGSSYSHSVTITATNNLYGNTDSGNVETSGTYTATSGISNEWYAKGRATTSNSAVDYSLVGTNKNLFGTNALMPEITDAWSISFYLYVDGKLYVNAAYDCIFAQFYNLPTNGAGLQIVYYCSTGNINTIRIGCSDGTNYFQYFYQLANNPQGWRHIVITKNTSIPSSTVDPYTVYENNSPISYWSPSTGGTGTLTSSSWTNKTITYTYLSTYHKYLAANNALNRNSTANILYDEFSFYSKELSSTEVNTIYNNGTPFDLTTLGAGYSLESWFRFGDGSSDNTASFYSYDIVGDTNRYFQSTNSADTTFGFTQLTSSSPIYVPASGAWANDYYVTKSSSAVNTAVSGINSGTTITNPLTSSWSYSFWFKSATNLSSSNITNGDYLYDEVLISAPTITTVSNSGWYTGHNLTVRLSSLRVNYHEAGGIYYIYSVNSINSKIYDGNWHNIIVTHSGTTNSASTWASNLKIYIDNGNAETAVSPVTNGTTTNANWTPYFGKGATDASGTNNYNNVSGMIRHYDEMAVWTSTALDATARTAIYNSGTPTDLKNTTGVTSPTVYYRGEDNTDLGYETISASNTTNETDIQQVAY